jgi:hypothetical protein
LSVRGNRKNLVFSKEEKGGKNKRGGREGGGGVRTYLQIPNLGHSYR